MNPMKIQHIPYNLRFKYPFTISKGTKTHQPTLVVSIEQFGHDWLWRSTSDYVLRNNR